MNSFRLEQFSSVMEGEFADLLASPMYAAVPTPHVLELYDGDTGNRFAEFGVEGWKYFPPSMDFIPDKISAVMWANGRVFALQDLGGDLWIDDTPGVTQ